MSTVKRATFSLVVPAADPSDRYKGKNITCLLIVLNLWCSSCPTWQIRFRRLVVEFVLYRVSVNMNSDKRFGTLFGSLGLLARTYWRIHVLLYVNRPVPNAVHPETFNCVNVTSLLFWLRCGTVYQNNSECCSTCCTPSTFNSPHARRISMI